MADGDDMTPEERAELEASIDRGRNRRRGATESRPKKCCDACARADARSGYAGWPRRNSTPESSGGVSIERQAPDLFDEAVPGRRGAIGTAPGSFPIARSAQRARDQTLSDAKDALPRVYFEPSSKRVRSG